MKRLQFDFADERVKELDDLVERTGLKTRAQFFNSALSLFEWAIREREAGRIIASVDEATDKYKEVEMPGFPALKKEIDIISAALESLFALSEEAYQGVISNLIFQKRQKGDSRDRLERMQLLDSQRDSADGRPRMASLHAHEPATRRVTPRIPWSASFPHPQYKQVRCRCRDL